MHTGLSLIYVQVGVYLLPYCPLVDGKIIFFWQAMAIAFGISIVLRYHDTLLWNLISLCTIGLEQNQMKLDFMNQMAP